MECAFGGNMGNEIKDWSVKLGKEVLFTSNMVISCYDAITSETERVQALLKQTTNLGKYKELNLRLKALNKVKPTANYK